MRLRRARVQNYRSVKDSGWFEVEDVKTILVGPNEGGKTAVLRALEQLNPGRLVRPLDPLRDFPRSEYHRIQSGAVKPADVVVAEAEFEAEGEDRQALAGISERFVDCHYYRAVRLDNTVKDRVLGAPNPPSVDELEAPLNRLVAGLGPGRPGPPAGSPFVAPPTAGEAEGEQAILTGGGLHEISVPDLERLMQWLESEVAPEVGGDLEQRGQDLASVRQAMATVHAYLLVLGEFRRRLPVMVYASTYPSVSPELHLGQLADALDTGAVDETDDRNFGNLCLLQLLGFSARELSELGQAKEPEPGDWEGFERYRAQLDERDAKLNFASRQLTEQIREVWDPSVEPDSDRPQDYEIRITADKQYLKLVVEDSLGVQIELDQRSHGFRWLLSFFVVFFAQASDPGQSAVLLLDEPALSLHGQRQQEFRRVLSRLGQSNQLIFTTHSPFLVGPDEIGLVRVVELADRKSGTKVRSDLAAQTPASILPLRQAVSYDLAQSLFSGRKVLILERLTDFWYLEATAGLLAEADMGSLDDEIEPVPLDSLSRMAYFPALAGDDGLRVAALLDTDAGGPHAEEQDVLVGQLRNRRVLRTQDCYHGPVAAPRIEEMLRETLLAVGRDLGWHAAGNGEGADATPVTEVLAGSAGSEFTPDRLAKAYVRWAKEHRAADLTVDERVLWTAFVQRVNAALS